MAREKSGAPDPGVAIEGAQKAANQAAEAATNQSLIKRCTREEIDRIETLAKSGSSEFMRVLDAVRYWHEEHKDGDPDRAREIKAFLADKP